MTELNAQNRTVFGKKTRALRRGGMIPAEIYGHGAENFHVAVHTKDFMAIYRTAGSHTVISLAMEAGAVPAVIAEVSRNPLTDEVLAVDFHVVKKGEKVRAKVPVSFTGTAPAAKAGFVVVELVHELEIEALPEHLLHAIEVSIDALEKPGDSVAVENLSLPAVVKLHVPADTTLAIVREHAKEAALPPAGESAAEPTTTVASEAAAEPEKK